MQLIKIYKKLYSVLGPQGWWPVHGKYFPAKLDDNARFEICVGAILTQNTAWKNVEISLQNLRNEKILSIDGILKTKNSKLAKLIRASNYQNQKARYLKNFAKYLKKNYDGKINEFFKKEINDLRNELLSIKGIGNETADSIILYAAEKPNFVVDSYTKRIAERLFGRKFKNYKELKEFFESQLPKDVKMLNELHALLVEFGKRYCTKAAPKCASCFLKEKCSYLNKKIIQDAKYKKQMKDDGE